MKMKQHRLQTIIRVMKEAAANNKRYSKLDKKVRGQRSKVLVNPTLGQTQNKVDPDEFVRKEEKEENADDKEKEEFIKIAEEIEQEAVMLFRKGKLPPF
jgi:hypothetical protein